MNVLNHKEYSTLNNYSNNEKHNLLAKDLYYKIINDNNSNFVYCLMKNDNSIKDLKQNINVKVVSSINAYSYISFIKKQIYEYWPIITNQLNIDKNKIKPKYLNFVTYNYIMKKTVNKCISEKNYFNEITISENSLSNVILLNMLKCRENLISYEQMKDRMLIDKNDSLKELSLNQMIKVIYEYENNLLMSGLLDNSMCIYVYNKYLLENELYLKNFHKIEYFLFEDYDMDIPIYKKLIDSMSEKTKVYICNKKDNNTNKLQGAMENLLQNKTFVLDDGLGITVDKDNYIYSDMIKKVKKCIVDEIEKSSTNIAVVVPNSNPYLEYELENEFGISNYLKRDRLLTNKYAHVVFVASCMYLREFELLLKEDYIKMYSFLFKADVLSVNALLDKIDINNDILLKKYDDFVDFVKQSKKTKNLTEFIKDIYLRYLFEIDNKEGVRTCAYILDELEMFEGVLKDMGMQNIQTEFLNELKFNMLDKSCIVEENRDVNIKLHSIYTLKNHTLESFDAQIWCDIGNAQHLARNEYLYNDYFYSSEYNGEYNLKIQEMFYENRLRHLMRALLLNCEKRVHMFFCENNMTGYEQNNVLLKLIHK